MSKDYYMTKHARCLIAMPEPERPQTVKDIVRLYLRCFHYDGMYHADIPCGCSVDEFPCCGDNFNECHPAYKRQCNGCGSTMYGPDRSSVEECVYCSDVTEEKESKMMTEKEIHTAIGLLSNAITAMERPRKLNSVEWEWDHTDKYASDLLEHLKEVRKVGEAAEVAEAEKEWLARCARAAELLRQLNKLREARCQKATLAFSELKARLGEAL